MMYMITIAAAFVRAVGRRVAGDGDDGARAGRGPARAARAGGAAALQHRGAHADARQPAAARLQRAQLAAGSRAPGVHHISCRYRG